MIFMFQKHQKNTILHSLQEIYKKLFVMPIHAYRYTKKVLVT